MTEGGATGGVGPVFHDEVTSQILARDRMKTLLACPPEFPVLFGDGGAGGIRTLETVSRLHTFQACAFDHSATAPSTAL